MENQSKQPTTDTNVGFFKKIFHHPNFNVVSGLVGIFGVVLAVYFYCESIKEPNLTYYISPTRTPIVQQGPLENLTVSFFGNQVTGNLSSAQIQIWNQGKAPIRKEEILQPIRLRTQNGEPIYKIVTKPSRQVIGFDLLPVSNAPNGSLEMDWRILEHNDGVQIQIIYGGSVNLPLIVDGVIIGQKELTQYKVEGGQVITSSWKRKLFATVLFIAGLSAILAVSLFAATVSERRIKSVAVGLVFIGGMVLGMFVIGFLTELVGHFILTPPKPPFGF